MKTNMLPIAPLMIEHRLIERMAALLKKELEAEKKNTTVNTCFIEAAVDFFKVYADRCHHGKEEDILFKKLVEKPLLPEHRKLMQELLNEHVQGRKLVEALSRAQEQYANRDPSARKEIGDTVNALVTLYQEHIRKEDKQFFIPSMTYFNKEEQAQMLEAFASFDAALVHGRYKKIVEGFEKGT